MALQMETLFLRHQRIVVWTNGSISKPILMTRIEYKYGYMEARFNSFPDYTSDDAGSSVVYWSSYGGRIQENSYYR